jgi:hypothetical protein
LSFFFCPLCCLSFDLRLTMIPLVSSNFSDNRWHPSHLGTSITLKVDIWSRTYDLNRVCLLIRSRSPNPLGSLILWWNALHEIYKYSPKWYCATVKDIRFVFPNFENKNASKYEEIVLFINDVSVNKQKTSWI